MQGTARNAKQRSAGSLALWLQRYAESVWKWGVSRRTRGAAWSFLAPSWRVSLLRPHWRPPSHEVREGVLLAAATLAVEVVPLPELRHARRLAAVAGADLVHGRHQIVQRQRAQLNWRRLGLALGPALLGLGPALLGEFPGPLVRRDGLFPRGRAGLRLRLLPLPRRLLLLLLLRLKEVADGAVRGGDAEVAQVTAGVALRQRGQRLKVELRLQLLVLEDDPQDGDAVADVRQVHQQAPRQAPDHGLVQVKRPVGGRQHQHAVALRGLQPVPVGHEFVLDLAHRLMLARLVAPAQHAVHLVDEDNTGGDLVREGEEGAHVLLALAKPLAGQR
mmetsp:Transcript_18668/g.47845  ORF Transcript_18668/g.47845 Transcript_18668/m.47845 type:complete len:332 (+) Transcript_18668:38-1033(+)